MNPFSCWKPASMSLSNSRGFQAEPQKLNPNKCLTRFPFDLRQIRWYHELNRTKENLKDKNLEKWMLGLKSYLRIVSLRILEEEWNRGRPWKQWGHTGQSSWKNSTAFSAGSRWWRWYPRMVRGSTGNIVMSVYQALLIIFNAITHEQCIKKWKSAIFQR